MAFKINVVGLFSNGEVGGSVCEWETKFIFEYYIAPRRVVRIRRVSKSKVYDS
jgi:hypothetical protein